MNLEDALNILDDEGLILERKSVKDMTPEEYQADLEKRRERRKKRLERKDGSTSSSESDEDLRKSNSEEIARGYREAERKISDELNEIRNEFNRYDMKSAIDPRSSLKNIIILKDKLASSNLLADIRTSKEASQLLDEIQRKITEIRRNIRRNAKPRYMDEFRYLEVSFDRTPTNDGRPMDEWGKPFRIYVWNLPDRFDPRYYKVSKSEFTKWLRGLKCKYLKKFKSGTRRNRITWDTYDIYTTVYEIVSRDGWTHKSNVYFEAYQKENIRIESVITNTGVTLV